MLAGLRTHHSGARLFVGLGAADAARARLADIMAAAPDAIWLAAAIGRRSVAALGAELAVWEAEHGLPDGATGIVASVESAAGAMAMGELPGASPRLQAIAWDEGRLRRSLGLAPDGAMPAPVEQVRSALVLAARAAGVPAIDTPHPGASGSGSFEDAVRLAFRDGYATKLAQDASELATVRRLMRALAREQSGIRPASDASG